MTLRLSEQHSYSDLTSIQAGVALTINLSNIMFYYNPLIEHSLIIQNSQELKKVKMANSGLRQHSVRVFYYKEKVI